MSTALHKLLAVDKTVRRKAEAAKTAAYHAIQRTDLFSGLVQSYEPNDIEGETFPREETWPQLNGDTVLNDYREAAADLINLTATKDAANTHASADVKIGDRTILTNVPATTLLYLEKQLNDTRTVLAKLPVPDPAKRWSFDPQTNLQRAPDEQRNKTKKLPRVLVKAPATERHQADTEVFMEDVVTGKYTISRYSSAVPAATVKAYLDRIDALIRAVKVAREEANTAEQDDVKYGDDIMNYLFAPVA